MSDGQRLEAAGFGAVGAGNMGGAIIRGSVERGGRSGGDWAIAEPDAEKRAAFERLGVATASSVDALGAMLRDDAVILLAVKPQMLPEVAGDLAGLLRGTGRSVLSILAGVTTAGVRASVERAGDGVGVEGWTGGVMRAMPNTPASVGKGATALASPRDVSSAQASAARDLLAPLGELYELDESQIDAFTAIAGSGPAYVFRFIEALAAAGRELGLPTEAAGRIAAATVVGAATLLEHDGGDPGGLREAVTSRGGTTAAALDSLNAADFVGIVGRAAAAAAKRAEELGQAR